MPSLLQRSRLNQVAIIAPDRSQIKKGKLAGLLVGMIISAMSLYAPILNAAPIYKVIDKQTGQVTFIDRPQSYEQQAGKQVSQTNVTTGTTASINDNNSSDRLSSQSNSKDNTSNESANNTEAAITPLPLAPKAVQVNYQLTITEPSEARAYRRPAQSIVVNLQLKPTLQAGDSVSIYLDGNEVAQGLSASISTVDILPGKHSIKATVRNEVGQIIKQTTRTVYVIQNTVMLQNNKKIAQQLLAYQQLPWHQKVLLKLRQNDIAKQ